MGRSLVPAAMVAAILALALAALAVGMTPYRPGSWQGAVHLAVLGGVIPMIYAVNLRIVPVFARRSWSGELWLRLQIGLAIAGAWAAFVGYLAHRSEAVVTGNALALIGGILFVANIARLFRQPVTLPALPLPFPEQPPVDAIATRFMRLSGMYLLVGLAVGLVTSVWRPDTGRWDLVWAHALLIGFFLSMASGVCYHVLPRWTGRAWQALAPIRLHFAIVALGLPVMLLALAMDRVVLFAIAGPLLALAIGLFLVTIGSMVPALPGLTRLAVAGAATMLLAGIGLGALFAFDPALGARLRLIHAEINLFGWTGLLISGVGYYLVPRFAGQPLRWPRLAAIQLGILITGVALGILALTWRVSGGGPDVLVFAAQGLVSASFMLFGIVVAGTFHSRQRRGGAVGSLSVGVRPAAVTGQ